MPSAAGRGGVRRGVRGLSGAEEAVGEGGEEGAEAVGEHVFLGVPGVALGAEEEEAGMGVGEGGVGPFEDFEEGREAENAQYGHGGEGAAAADEAAVFEKLHRGPGEEADGKVADAVVVVAGEAEGVRTSGLPS